MYLVYLGEGLVEQLHQLLLIRHRSPHGEGLVNSINK
jgi:hypothetical protein